MKRRHTYLARFAALCILALAPVILAQSPGPAGASNRIMSGTLPAELVLGTFRSAPARSRIDARLSDSIWTIVPVQDDVTRLLEMWARSGEPDPILLNRLLAKIDITSKKAEEELLAKMAAAGAQSPGGASAFVEKVRDTLDRTRYAKVDTAIQEVLDAFGGELEGVIRTGSSGQRYLQLKGAGQGSSSYRTLFSDDDISFVGKKAQDAARMLNSILEREGMGALKVRGMDLGSLRNIRGIDLTALDLLEPEKFLGESGIGSLKPEMMEKGAVIAEQSAAGMTMRPSPLRQFVESKKSRMIADLIDDKAVKATVEKFGALTLVGSCERQIVTAHGGWQNLSDPEKVKYVLRQRLALTESGAMKNIAEEGVSFSQATLVKLRELKNKATLTAEELQWVSNLRTQNIDLAFKEIPHKLAPIIDAAENSGRSLASNPEARRMMNELATGFALMRDRILDIPEDQVIAKLKSLAGDNKEMYSMLYTSFQQSKDLVQALDQWVASGGTREAFLEMLVKAENRLARLQQVIARKAKKAKAPEAKTLTAMEEMLGTDLGDTFLMKMAKNPAAKKVVLSAMVATGGALCLKALYNSWERGSFKDDLSWAVLGIIDFLPGGIGAKRAYVEGMDMTTVLLFVKDALYLTPAWPIVLAGDMLMIAVDLGAAYKIQMQQAGLVDVLVYNGEFDLSGDSAKFIKLTLPDGSAWGPDGLKDWLFQTKAVRVKHAVEGKEYFINDLSAVSTDLLDKAFIPEDPVTQQLRLAAEQQINAINAAEVQDATLKGDLFGESVAFGRWLFGFETVCNKSPEKWCRVFELLKKKIVDRREVVKEKVMVPQLIEMAEAKKSQLNAATATEAKIDKLQEKFEGVRGSKLEVKLSAKVKERADAIANEVRSDTAEDRTMKRGKYWLEAYAAYSRIWKWGKDIKSNIIARTGWEQAQVFQFKWTGEPEDDERKANQSRAGFAAELSKIQKAILKIKGKQPSPTDAIDKEAFAILCDVVFRWRMALDQTDTATPGEGSSYFTEYDEAIEKVKELYAGSREFQELLDKGAQLVKGQDLLVLDRGTAFEIKFRDPSLVKMYSDGQLSLSWSTTANGDFSPNNKDPKTNYAPFSPEPVTITVTVERSGTSKAKGSLSAKMTVVVPENFLTLALTPPQPKPGQIVGVEASILERFFGGIPSFHYRWSCDNCKIDDFDRTRTPVTAPKTGNSTVTCELLVDGSDGRTVTLLRRSISFNVTAAQSPTPTATPTGTHTPRPTASPTPTTSPAPTASPTSTRPKASPTPTPAGPKGPTEAELKARYMNCLCRCYCGWAGHIGVWWDPEEKTKPECDSSGPCIGGIGAFGCSSRHYFGAPNDCAKGCYEGAYGKGTYDEKKADQIRREENRKFMKPLSLKLNQQSCPVIAQLGDTINFSVAVTGGIPPHKVTWSGNGSPKDNTFTFANSRQAGTYPISVTVSDDEGNTATASCSVIVEVMTVKIDLLDKENKITFGQSRSFRATVMSGNKPARGNFYFLWQPHPEIQFNPFEYNGGTVSGTRAVFNKLGTSRVWAVAHTREGEKLTSVGESDQIEIEVGKPELKLTLTPEKGVVSSQVKAKVTTDVPGLKEIDYRWETTANGKLLSESKDSSEITFSPQDTKPVTITVNARVPGTGDDLGNQTATFTASPLDVKVTVLGTEGPKPQIWKEGVGLVTVEREIAVHQFVNLRADATPAMDGLRFEWMLNEDSHFAGNNITQAIRAYRSQTGSCEATVVVRNSEGIELGRGTGNFNVSISQADLDKAKNMGGTDEKLANAKALVSKGQLDEGIVLVDEVVRAAPKNTEASGLANKWKADRTTIQTQLGKVRTLIDQQKFTDASKELSVAKNLHGLYPPVAAIEKELNEKSAKFDAGVRDAVASIKSAIDARDFKKALQLSAETRSKFKLIPATEQTVKGYDDFARSHEAEKERIRGVLKQGEAKYNGGDYAGALADFAQLWVNFDTYWNNSIDPEPKHYENLRNQAQTRRDRVNLLIPQIKQAVENPTFDRRQLESASALVNELLQLQPGNAVAQGYKSAIAEKLSRGEKGAKADDAVKRGDQLATERKWPEAVKAYDEAIKADPSNANSHRLRGRAKREAGDLNGSLKDFDKAIELDPGNHQTWLGRGLTKDKLGDKAGAMADFDRGIAINPNYAAGYNYRASVKLDQKDYAGAKAEYDRAIAIDPKNAVSFANRAFAKANLGDRNGAIADYTKAIEINPNNAIAYNNRGHAKQQLGDLKGAQADYEKAIAIDPNYKTPQNNLAKLKEQMEGGTVTATTNAGSRFYPVDLTPIGGRKATPRKVKDIEMDDSSGIRLKSTDEKRLTMTVPIPVAFSTSRIAIVSNLDDATYLDQGATIAIMFVTTDAGTKSFRIQAGVHSSEWNYGVGPKHKRVDGLDIGDNRFLAVFDLGTPTVVRGIRFEYVETNSEKWYGHAPGFVLRGVTLIGPGGNVSQPVVTPKPTPTPISTPRPTPVAVTGTESEIFNNGNIGGVYNQPTAATQFTINRPYLITSIMTYHWNNARGTTRLGTVSIKGGDGRVYGPWAATGSPGQGGVPNAYWNVRPNVTIPAGTYTIVDSDPATWAQNAQSGGRGHAIVKGRAAATVTAAPTPTPVRAPTPVRTAAGRYVTAILENRSSEAVHIFAEGDNFGPGNKIAPGEKREVRVLMTSTGRIKFTAGRNGQVIATRFWDGDPDDLSRYPRITFDGRSLIVVTGLR